MFAHHVYFTLKDESPSERERFLASCRKHLDQHEGLESFGVGVLADVAAPANVRDFHVGMAMLFCDRAAHDRYVEHPRHQQFLDENEAGWAEVRVFDFDL
jgi:hypothetical protein